MGDKIESKKLAQAAGSASCPDIGRDADTGEAIRIAAEIAIR